MFQARGLPPIHGVSWIEKDALKSRGIEGDLLDNEEAALKLDLRDRLERSPRRMVSLKEMIPTRRTLTFS